MKETLTFEQVLQICIDQLNRIPITVGQTETVGGPIKIVIGNLEACIEAMQRSKPETEEPADGRETDAE